MEDDHRLAESPDSPAGLGAKSEIAHDTHAVCGIIWTERSIIIIIIVIIHRMS